MPFMELSVNTKVTGQVVELKEGMQTIACGAYFHNGKCYPIIADTDVRHKNGIVGWVVANTQVQNGEEFPLAIENENELIYLAIPPITCCTAIDPDDLTYMMKALVCDGIIFAENKLYKFVGDSVYVFATNGIRVAPVTAYQEVLDIKALK